MNPSTRPPHGRPWDAVWLLHYGWPVLMGWALSEVVLEAGHRPGSTAGRDVFLWCILAAYSLDRLLDRAAEPPSRVLVTSLWLGFGVALAGTAMALPGLPSGTLALLPVLSLASLGYRRLKPYPLVKALLVPLVWTWACLALPVADGSWFGWRSLLQPVGGPLFLLLASGTALCDVKDLAADRDGGVRSLPVQMGIPWTLGIAALAALAGAGWALALGKECLAAGGLLLGGLACLPQVLARKPLGPLLVDAVLTLPGLLVWLRRT